MARGDMNNGEINVFARISKCLTDSITDIESNTADEPDERAHAFLVRLDIGD